MATKTVRYGNTMFTDQEPVSAYKNWGNRFAYTKTYSFSDSVATGAKSVGRFWKLLKRGEFDVSIEDSKISADSQKASKAIIFNPNSRFLKQWNKIFLVSCMISLFLDPLFFYLPAMSNDETSKDQCIKIQKHLEVIVTTLRTITDGFYLFHIALQFRTAYVAPSSRVFGTGVLVDDPKKIRNRYLSKDFWMDLIAVLPIPQIVIWIIVPNSTGPVEYQTKNVLRFVVFLQYLPRLYLIFPLRAQIVKTTGVVTKTAWAGAAYNLALYMLASHFIGACWYLFAIERKDTCWRRQCVSSANCTNYLYCSSLSDPLRQQWLETTTVFQNCSSDSPSFDFGIYKDSYTKKITTSNFAEKYLYCLWYGLQQLSSLGQNLQTSLFAGEIIFAIFIAIFGLVLFAQLIGNMQTYLQSLGVRLEEWRVKQNDTEEWMRHRQLPKELRERVRRYNQYKWVATRGVDEEGLLQSLPSDLRRYIKRHLCLNLILQVPLFKEMDAKLRDAVCEHLQPVLCTKHTVIMREGDPVNEMLFIIRGVLDSVTTNGGRTGFFNQTKLGPGHFCGEELLTWILNPKPSINLPTSTRTVHAETEVEAFALMAEDLMFVAKQFRRLHSKKIQQTFRFYSHQWRTWAACYIQSTWKRYKKRRSLAELYSKEQGKINGGDDNRLLFPNNGGLSRTDDQCLKVSKPEELDFGVDPED